MKQNQAVLTYHAIPGIETYNVATPFEPTDFKHHHRSPLKLKLLDYDTGNDFACLSMEGKRDEREYAPTKAQLVKHPLAIVALVPKDASLFAAGAIAGAAAQTVTVPLDRIKLLMQTHGVRIGQESAKKAIGFIEAISLIGKEEGLKGYWKGNLPQVIRIIPYSAVQLFSYEIYKVIFENHLVLPCKSKYVSSVV